MYFYFLKVYFCQKIIFNKETNGLLSYLQLIFIRKIKTLTGLFFRGLYNLRDLEYGRWCVPIIFYSIWITRHFFYPFLKLKSLLISRAQSQKFLHQFLSKKRWRFTKYMNDEFIPNSRWTMNSSRSIPKVDWLWIKRVLR